MIHSRGHEVPREGPTLPLFHVRPVAVHDCLLHTVPFTRSCQLRVGPHPGPQYPGPVWVWVCVGVCGCPSTLGRCVCGCVWVCVGGCGWVWVSQHSGPMWACVGVGGCGWVWVSQHPGSQHPLLVRGLHWDIPTCQQLQVNRGTLVSRRSRRVPLMVRGRHAGIYPTQLTPLFVAPMCVAEPHLEGRPVAHRWLALELELLLTFERLVTHSATRLAGAQKRPAHPVVLGVR